MLAFPAAVFLLCLATSILCLALLVRAYLRSQSRLLFWAAACFVLLAINNGLLFLDMVIVPEGDLRVVRHLTALAAISTLLYGFIWDMES
jgi:heme/copper-type cytochrome/quinol oxidase subunit 4